MLQLHRIVEGGLRLVRARHREVDLPQHLVLMLMVFCSESACGEGYRGGRCRARITDIATPEVLSCLFAQNTTSDRPPQHVFAGSIAVLQIIFCADAN
jgi:hypothetical protein